MRRFSLVLLPVLFVATLQAKGCAKPVPPSPPDPNTFFVNEQQRVINLDYPYDIHVSGYDAQMYGEVFGSPASNATGSNSTWQGYPIMQGGGGNARATLTNMVLPATYRFKISQPSAFCYNVYASPQPMVAGGDYGYICPIYVNTGVYAFEDSPSAASYDSSGVQVVPPNYIGELLDDGDHQFMYSGDGLQSSNGDWVLLYQSDGNLVEYNSSYLMVWESGTDGAGGGNAHVHLQQGNLVVYNSGTSPVFASNTGGHSGAYLVMQNDGNIVIYDAGNSPLWSTGIP